MLLITIQRTAYRINLQYYLVKQLFSYNAERVKLDYL